MVRYLIAAVVGCLYVAGSIWIVQREGQTFREGLSKTKNPVSEIEKASVPAADAKDRAIPSPSVAAVDVNKPQFEPAIPKPAPAAVADAPARHLGGQAAPATPPVAVAKAEHAAHRPAHKANHHPAGKAAPGHPLADHAFWNQPQLTRVWDVSVFKTDDERRLCDQIHELIVRFNPLVADASPWVSRVEDAADPFLKSLHRPEIKYNFFILNSDAVNAFSIPGGNVYISRGLFDLIGEDEDYALQFAVGHEIAHVDLEHAIKCLRDPGVMKLTEGTITKLYMLILPFGYMQSNPVDQEFEADEWVATRMKRSRSRREILVFLQKLEGYSKSHGFFDGRIKPQPGHDLSPLENHYRAQTAARKRLKHLKEFIDQPAKDAK
jgi:hypothetical protein